MSAWSKLKADAFKKEFFDFLKEVRIHSKETGGFTCLGDRLYTAQTFVLDQIFDGLTDDIHDFKVLKSRQLGLSTISRAFSLFWLGMHEGLQGAIIMDTDSNKELARREIESMIENLPKRVAFPRIETFNRYGITLENGSKIQFMAAGSRKGRSGGGLGRSSGLNFVHASEMCSWENEEGVEALKAALSENFEDRLYIWESTARGYNVWHDMWQEAIADDLNQRGIFLGWYLKDSQRLEPGTKAFEKYGSDPLSDNEKERIAKVKELYGVDVTLPQVAWYRQKVDPNKALEAGAEEDPLKRQEQPWTAEEAFVLSGSSFFSAEVLTRLAAKTASSDYTSYRFFPGSDFFGTKIERARSARDIQLKVWEEPVDHSTYVIAADPAFGHDEKNNNAAIQVLRCFADRIEQVAEFADALTPTNHFAWVIASLAGWYSGGPLGAFNNNVEVIIEINGPGEAVLNEWKALKAIVDNPYMRGKDAPPGIQNIFNNVRNYLYTRTDSMMAGQALMWKTTGQLKESILSRLRDFLNSEILIVRSQAWLEEAKGIVRDGSSIGAEGKNRDDRIYAIAMAVRAWEDRLRRNLIYDNKTKQRDDEMRKLTAADRFQIFNRNQLDTFFQGKRMDRLRQAQVRRYESWRYR